MIKQQRHILLSQTTHRKLRAFARPGSPYFETGELMPDGRVRIPVSDEVADRFEACGGEKTLLTLMRAITS